MASKFKVGDRVVCIKPKGLTPRFDLSGEGFYTVSEVGRVSTVGLVKRQDMPTSGMLYDDHRFAHFTRSSGNPKDLIGSKKPAFWAVPMLSIYKMAGAFIDGARKYGAFNWREQPVNADVYVNAARRHIDQWFAGETSAEDSGVHHLAHAMACLAILIDAEGNETLNDNRHGDKAFLNWLKENSR